MVVSGCTGACGSTPPNYTNGQANTILGIIAQCMGRNIPISSYPPFWTCSAQTLSHSLVTAQAHQTNGRGTCM